ncbi:Anoctamin-7 [Halocaridina rubra]|uniref:Anoctamin-7 n=1 Tax=Halocaridina rubra TaxID=373956 RepID=A0AAN8XVF8_HALRR
MVVIRGKAYDEKLTSLWAASGYHEVKSLDMLFLGSDSPETYFTSTQRSRIVHEILSTASFGKRKKGEIGIERLIDEGIYSAAFPLHDEI